MIFVQDFFQKLSLQNFTLVLKSNECNNVRAQHNFSVKFGLFFDGVPFDRTVPFFSLQFQKLKKQRDELKKYQKKINAVLEKDRLMAKKLLQEGKKE